MTASDLKVQMRDSTPTKELDKRFVQTAVNIIREPEQFFSSVKGRDSYREPWIYYAKVFAAFIIIYIIAGIPLFISSFSTDPSILILSEEYGLAATIIFVILSLLILFALLYIFQAALIHLFMLIAGAKKGYLETFKIVAYSSTPAILTAPFVFLGVFEFGSIILFLIFLAAAIYIMVIEVKGAKVLHEVSLKRAVVGMVILPIVALIILAVIVFVILYLGYSAVIA